MRRGFVVLAALTLLPCAAWPQGDPLGPEFRVNTYTTGDQGYSPVAAADPSGTFVVVWASQGQDGSATGIFGQRYASSGVPLGSEFAVNSYTTNYQSRPSVAADSSGNFVVVWQSLGQDGSGGGIFGQRYASSGVSLGAEFRVNTNTTGVQEHPSVAAASSGDFIVVWDMVSGVFGQRYASSGAPLGPEFRVNTSTSGYEYLASVGSDSPGNFVVAWCSEVGFIGCSEVKAQRYASSGAPLGPEFRVNTYTTNLQRDPSIAVDPSGNFVVVWTSLEQDGSNFGIFGQRYASSGAALGAEFRVNTYTTDSQALPWVTADSSGNFVVVWDSLQQDGGIFGIFGQRYASSGAALGAEFRVNSYTTSSQRFPSAAAEPSGNFVVVWRSDGQDGSALGVFGQRYSMIVPVELMDARVE